MTTTDKSRADALTDLLPCPFCGSAASLNSDHIDYFVLCDTCSGEGPRLQSPTGNHEASKRGAIAAWNARAPVETMSADALKTIAEFPITDPANMDALNMRKIAADAIAAPAEQHEAAPAEKGFRSIEEWNAEYLPKGMSEDPKDLIPQLAPSAPLEAAPWRGACEHTTANMACRICREKHGESYDQRTTQPAPTAPLEGTGNGADEADDYPPTPESERAAFNAMMRWHLIRLLQAWRYGGDLRAAGMAAFEWARTNNVGQQAFKASENAMKLAARAPRADAAAAPAVANREDWQQKALDRGFTYWRAPDAHGVECTAQQAIDLLQDLLGVEVDIKDAAAAQVANRQGLTDEEFEDWLLVLLINHLDSKALHYCTYSQMKDGIEITRVTTYVMKLARALLEDAKHE